MKLTLSPLLIFAYSSALTVSHAFALADDSADFRKYFHSLAPKVVAAYDAKDSKFFDQLYAPDFQATDDRGVTTGKKVSLFLLRYHFNMLKKVDYKMSLVALTAAHGTATLTLKTVMDGVMQDRRGVPGSPMSLTRIEKQVFVKRGNSWAMSLAKDIKPAALLIKSAPYAKSMKMLTGAGRPATKLIPAGGHSPDR